MHTKIDNVCLHGMSSYQNKQDLLLSYVDMGPENYEFISPESSHLKYAINIRKLNESIFISFKYNHPLCKFTPKKRLIKIFPVESRNNVNLLPMLYIFEIKKKIKDFNRLFIN